VNTIRDLAGLLRDVLADDFDDPPEVAQAIGSVFALMLATALVEGRARMASAAA
jgi:hypothetical protein